LRKIKNRLLDTAYAATHLGHLLSSDEQLRADHVLAQFLNWDAEQRAWGIRWEITREKIGTERVAVPGGTREFNIRRGALRLVELRPGAINEAALAALAAKPAPHSLPWIFLWLLRLGLEPLVDTAEFRARATEEYRRVRKNVVGADFDEITDRIDLLDRKAVHVRKERWSDLIGRVRYWNAALERQGIEGIVPRLWRMSRGILPERQHHHISRIPLRDYSQPIPYGRIRNKSGGLIDTGENPWGSRQKAASIVSCVLITPVLEAHYLARVLLPEAMQRTLERCGRLYRLNCWFDYLGRVPRDRRKASGAGFSYDVEKANEGESAGGEGARPRLAALEKKHEEQLKRGLESDIRYAPQGGTVKISRPASALRHAELKRDMAAHNEKHLSMWNMGSSSRKYYRTLNVLADNVDNGEQWKNSIEQKETLHVRKSGLVEPDAERDGVHRRLLAAGGAAEDLRTAASGGDSAGGSKTRPRELLLAGAQRRARTSCG
jgi:hypothetical protein